MGQKPEASRVHAEPVNPTSLLGIFNFEVLDSFAGQAMQSMLSKSTSPSIEDTYPLLAKKAYKMAVEMMKVREALLDQMKSEQPWIKKATLNAEAEARKRFEEGWDQSPLNASRKGGAE